MSLLYWQLEERVRLKQISKSAWSLTTAAAELCFLPISLSCYFLILFLNQRSLHTFSALRTRCVQTHRFTLYACQFLNEKELSVLPLKHSYFLLFIKAVLFLRGKSHSFCTIKSNCILHRESARQFQFSSEIVFLWQGNKSCEVKTVSMFLSAYCLFSSYGCFPADICHGNVYALGNIPASIISSDFWEPLLKVINLFPLEKKSSQ